MDGVGPGSLLLAIVHTTCMYAMNESMFFYVYVRVEVTIHTYSLLDIMYVCMYMYIYIYIYIYTDIMYVCIYIYIYIYVYLHGYHVCIHIFGALQPKCGHVCVKYACTC